MEIINNGVSEEIWKFDVLAAELEEDEAEPKLSKKSIDSFSILWFIVSKTLRRSMKTANINYLHPCFS